MMISTVQNFRLTKEAILHHQSYFDRVRVHARARRVCVCARVCVRVRRACAFGVCVCVCNISNSTVVLKTFSSLMDIPNEVGVLFTQ
jgi:hypothetical protein